MAIKANIWAGDADAKNVLVNSINYVDDYQKKLFYALHFIDMLVFINMVIV